MSSEKTTRVSRKEPRQLKELRSLLPWGWDARAIAHPPGKKTLRDFQECRKFLDPSAVDERGSIRSSTAYRKRHKKDGKENNVMGQKSVLLTAARTHCEGSLADDSNIDPSREIQTPLVEYKTSMDHSDAPASLDDNPCTGVSLVTPLDQQCNGQRLAINTMGSSISTGLAFTPGLRATPITEEAPRPVGSSESPVLPKKFGGADSPGISDLPDIVAHAKGQPSAEGALPYSLDGDQVLKVDAEMQQTEPCSSDTSAQHACHQLEADGVDLCDGQEAGNSPNLETSPRTAQAEIQPAAIPEDAVRTDLTPPAVQQASLAPSSTCQQSTAAAGLPIQSLPWKELPEASAVLTIPCLDTTRVASISPGAAVLRPQTAQEGPRTCPPLFRPLEQAVPAAHGSQKREESKIEAPSTALQAKQAQRVRLQDSQPVQKTAPRTLAIADLAVGPYKEAVGDLWREKWGWSRPVPRTAEARTPHQRACRLEARFLEGCRNLMRLQCDGDRSWQELAKQHGRSQLLGASLQR